MRPAVDITLNAVAEDLAKKLAFVPPGNERMMMKGMLMLFSLLARDADDAAATPLAQIDELAVLFREAAAACPAALAEQLLAAVAKAAHARDDVRISALERVLDELRQALIALQTWLESSTHADAEALLGRCWDFLVRANARRVYLDRPW